MSDFTFAEPQWLHGLWGVALFAAMLLFFEHRAGRRAESLVSPLLQERLVAGPSLGQRRARIALLSLAGIFAVLALMRPQWGFEYIKTPRSSAELMIALDVSRSMLAEDVAPSRLERAKAEVRDLLEYLGGDHVGLIAFAGRASVLAPMTPDFGFFRLVLDELGPHSVGLGGTRLEEPIRKAIAGFRATGDVSRVLLLITDGEDHDSFPIEAAKDAAERGIRIIAIGFGSESGSEIPITDPQTGARTLLRDSDGKVVRSRLDGDTLREMALVTEGVYVPAGVGALDLESIYDKHIKNLMRAEIDGEGRVVRTEGFQWAVLAALIALLASVCIGQGARRPSEGGRQVAVGVALAFVLLGADVRVSFAQQPAADPTDASVAETQAALEALGEAAAAEGSSEMTTEGHGEEEPQRDPREAYNDALLLLEAKSFDEADRLFEVARAAAGTDGEARYRATYGLGFAASARADALLEPEPEQALEALYRAGDYFREAVRLQPANEDPRYNLEVVQQRARVLADALARKDERAIAEALDDLIERQREQATGVRGLLESIEAADQGAQLDDSFRREFRSLSTQQRQLLSDSDGFAQRVANERDQLEAKPEEERTPEDQIQMVQLDQLQIHLQKARERMGHARRELRGRRGERAYRRVAAALADLKHARDQLRDPVQILDAVLRDAGELARYTQAMSIAGMDLPSLQPDSAADPSAPEPLSVPPWLSADYLRESQQSVNERADELHQRLAAGVAQYQQQRDAGAVSEPEDPEAAQQERLMRRVVEAEPLVGQGVSALGDALLSLEVEDFSRGFEHQSAGLQALANARERFLDLRRVIELTYADQQRLQNVLERAVTSGPSAVVDEERDEAAADEPDPGPADETHDPAQPASVPPLDLTEYLPALRELQQRNIVRGDRIAGLIEEEREALPDESDPAQGEEGEEQLEQARQRLELASQILMLTQSAMNGVVDGLATSPGEAADAQPWSQARSSGEQASNGLENLRRLFFTLLEHLKDTARRQQELNDETEEVAALPDGDVPARLGPLVPRQGALAETAGVIANALEEQSRQSPTDLVDPNAAGAGPDAQAQAQAAADEAQRMRIAAELTLAAQVDMEGVGEALEAEEPDLTQARSQQDSALENLIEAIKALTPPQEQNQDQQQDQNQEQQQQQQQQPQPQEQQQQQQQESDPSQLLQEVRDREAQRRQEKAKRQQDHRNTVERDW